MTVAPLHRTLEQELQALMRGASLECLVCGEFVLHRDWSRGLRISCPECGAGLRDAADSAGSGLQFSSQAG
jgi:uncharacterized protein (DUF983 family)